MTHAVKIDRPALWVDGVGASPYCALPVLDDATFEKVRLATIFDCCKWDPQVEDVGTLAPFALLLKRSAWRELAECAGQLARETAAMERAILTRPEMLKCLALPRCIRRVLRKQRGPAVAMARLIRFDFHWTTEGWRLSEANTDVPGGMVEASGFSRVMARRYRGTALAADPVAMYVEAICRSVPRGGHVALVHASGYVDDVQVMQFVANYLAERDRVCHLVNPAQVVFAGGRAQLVGGAREEIDGIVRFYPAEWLPALGRKALWTPYFCDAGIPQSNPATALVTQSKRLPLIWDALGVDAPTWRALLPETRAVGDVAWRSDRNWVIKPALGRVGDGILLQEVTASDEARVIARAARWFPGQFVAQRRFSAVPLDTPQGRRYPCLGVYTVDGEAAGIYGRLSVLPLVNHLATDVPVLVPTDDFLE